MQNSLFIFPQNKNLDKSVQNRVLKNGMNVELYFCSQKKTIRPFTSSMNMALDCRMKIVIVACEIAVQNIYHRM